MRYKNDKKISNLSSPDSLFQAQNAPKSVFGRLCPGPRWGSLWRSPRPTSRLGRGIPLPIPLPARRLRPPSTQNPGYASVEKGRQMRVGWSKMAIFASFAHYIFLLNCNIQCHNYYTVIYSRLGGFQWHQNRWPSITVNGYFALKTVFGSASNGLAYSGFQAKLFGNLQKLAYTFGGKNVVPATQFLAV